MVAHLVCAELRKHCALHSCLGDVKVVGSPYRIFYEVYAFILQGAYILSNIQ